MRRFKLLSMALLLAMLGACSESHYDPALYQSRLLTQEPARPTTLSLGEPVYQDTLPTPSQVLRKHVVHEYWTKVGADPFAHTPKEAMEKRGHAFRALGLKGACLKEALEVTAKPGALGRLNSGDFIDAMESGHGIHRNVQFASKEHPSLVTNEWQISCGGKTIRIVRPMICFNWSLILSGPAAPARTECREISFNAVPFNGKRVARVRWTVNSADGKPLPPSPCNAQKQGNGAWTAWVGQWCNCTVNLSYVRQILGPTADTPHRQTYSVTAVRQALRFDASIVNDVVQICLEDEAGARTCGVYVRPQDWQGRSVVPILDSLWKRDEGNCP